MEFLKSKALMTIKEAEFERENKTSKKQGECNLTCTEECFKDNENGKSASEILEKCVKKRCGCENAADKQGNDLFLKESCNETTVVEVIEWKPEDSHEKKKHKQQDQHVQTTFTVDFTVKHDTCCLNFNWELSSGDNYEGKHQKGRKNNYN